MTRLHDDPKSFRDNFVIIRVAPDHVQLFWRERTTWTCWHRGREQPEEPRRLAECREHIVPYVEDGYALLLREIVRGRFPDEKFRFYA